MQRQELVNYWIQLALHDLETAGSLLNSKRNDACLFFCHLSLEKMLKALWIIENTADEPPKTHNLLRLATETTFPVDDKTGIQLQRFTDFNLQSR